MNWFTSNDKLAGTETLNNPITDDDGKKEWSMPFSTLDFDKFLFALNDFTQYAIVSKDDINDTNKTVVTASSVHDGS
jgi:hypothetical protein